MGAISKRSFLIFCALIVCLAGCDSRSSVPSSEPSSRSAEIVSETGSGTQPASSPSAESGGAPSSASGVSAGEGANAPAAAEVKAPSTATTPISEAPERAQEARRVGEIVYTEGSVLLYRGGQEPAEADVGQVVENFDVVQTGPKSRATLELAPGSPGGAEIVLAENTAFYYESALSDSKARKTVLQLLAGSVALKIEKLADGEFRVGADSATLGVRGTIFIVNTIPDGALLVTCVEGRVEVDGDSGERLYAQPGRVVSQAAGEPIREELVSTDKLADYRVSWVDENLRSLEGRAPRVVAEFADRYGKALVAFDAAYGKLQEQSRVLEAWSVARDTGGEPSFTDWMVEKKAVAPVLFDCLSALFRLERPFYRLQEFALLRERGTVIGTLPDGRDATAFFSDFRTSAPAVAKKLAYVRRALLLFKYASAGSPLGQFFGAKAEAMGTGALFLDD